MGSENQEPLKTIGVGTELFHNLIENNRYYVDKTPFIKTVFKDTGSDVMLIARPRRFGKTLTMSTFYDFLSFNPENPDDVSRQEGWFKDTEICRNAEYRDFCREYMGKFPVVFISMKDVAADNFDVAYYQLGNVVFDAYNSFGYLADSPKLNNAEKKIFRSIADDVEYICNPVNQKQMTVSLSRLIEFLCKHHGVKPILLIDEYDVPIAKAAFQGPDFYRGMTDIIRTFLSKALKTNKYLGRAVLTGCLRAAKESIFTGLNNLDVCSVLDAGNDEISGGVGFTEKETRSVLSYYGLEDCYETVREHYDGYNFGNARMYCPWSLMSFCNDNYRNVGRKNVPVSARNYWINTSGNDAVEEFMGFIESKDVERMQRLLDGGTIVSRISETLCYGDLEKHNVEDLWTLLLYTGYLTVDPDCRQTTGEDGGVRSLASDERGLKIPNMEVRNSFEKKIRSFFTGNPVMKGLARTFIKGLLGGEAETVQESLQNLLRKYVSIRDLSARPPKENYYHGFVNGLLTGNVAYIGEHKSNMEAGDGYVDIIVASPRGDTVAILELKQTDRPLGARVTSAAGALKQIQEKRYADEYMDDLLVTSVYAYGICFHRKYCAVVGSRLK